MPHKCKSEKTIKGKTMDSVARFLISGTNTQHIAFSCKTRLFLNLIERRKSTIYYTCLNENREMALDAARETGVTVQEIKLYDDNENLVMVVKGEHPGWKKKASKIKIGDNGGVK